MNAPPLYDFQLNELAPRFNKGERLKEDVKIKDEDKYCSKMCEYQSK